MGTPAAAYYRMSTDRQETSIPDQRKAVQEYADQHGYQIVREYLDEGVSGWKSAQRAGFSRLIDDAESGDFRAVLCWDIDRFSRFDPLEANHYWYLLDRAGVHLATVAQGKLDWHDLGGWLSASVQQHGKSQYVKDLARNSARGTREAKLAGKWCGPPPYGYRTENRRLVPFPEEEKVVKRIFEMRLAGSTLSAIAAALNSEGIPTPRKTHWKTTHVRTILERPAYRGVTVVGLYSSGKFSRITQEPVEVPDTHPAIIPEDTWHQVQRSKVRERGRGGGAGGRLSGLVYCGRCGGPMYCNRVTGGNRYYLCSNYHNGRMKSGVCCGYCAVESGRLERAVLEALQQRWVGQSDRLAALVAAKLARETTATQAGQAARLRKSLNALASRISQATERMLSVDADLMEVAQQSLRGLIAERDDLARRIEDIESQAAEEVDPAQVVALLADFPAAIKRSEGVADARERAGRIIGRVECGFEFDTERSTPKRKRYRWSSGKILFSSTDERTNHQRFLPCSVQSGLPSSDTPAAGRCGSRRGRG